MPGGHPILGWCAVLVSTFVAATTYHLATSSSREGESMDTRVTRALGKGGVVLGAALAILAFCGVFALVSWLVSATHAELLR